VAEGDTSGAEPQSPEPTAEAAPEAEASVAEGVSGAEPQAPSDEPTETTDEPAEEATASDAEKKES